MSRSSHLQKIKAASATLVWLITLVPASVIAQTPAEKDATEAAELEDAEAAVIEESVKEQTRERETGAEEDPIAQRQASKVDTPVEHVTKPNEFEAYTSLRVQYREGSDGNSQLDDGGSRVGADGNWQFRPSYWLGGRAEVGFNVLNSLDSIINPGASSSDGDDEVFLRLLYAAIETPKGFAILGKAWSTYYNVAGFTDRFQGTGGSASGAFNAGTDGGPSGTGRADEVLQTRIQIDPSRYHAKRLKPFTLNVQFQNNQEIPSVLAVEDNGDVQGFNYGYAAGLSALLQTRDNFNLGIAYNHADIKEEDQQALEQVGIDGDAKALLLGAKWFSENWYLASNFSWMWNHMTTADGIYFDGNGWETYGQYNLYKRWWAIAGWNYLKPNDNQLQAGNFQIKYGVLGLRYSFKQFKQMLYANIRFDSSTAADAETTDIDFSNIYTIGIRWDYPR